MEKEDGVWRTIRGRRIFIRSGESLGSAMSRSGKFKRSDITESKREESFYARNKKNLLGKSYNERKAQKNINKFRSKYYEKPYNEQRINNNFKDNQHTKNQIYEQGHINKNATTRVERNRNKYSYADIQELKHEELQKKLKEYKDKTMSPVHGWSLSMYEEIEKNGKQAREGMYQQEQEEKSRKDKAKSKWGKSRNGVIQQIQLMEKNMEKSKKMEDFIAKKQSNNKIETERELYERAKNNPDSIDPMTENSTDWEALEKKYGNSDDNKSIKELNEEMLGDRYKGKGETPNLVYSHNRRIDIDKDGKATIWKDGKIERKTNLPDNVKGDKTKQYFDDYLGKLDNENKLKDELSIDNNFSQTIGMTGDVKLYSQNDLKRMEEQGIRPMKDSYTGGGWEGVNSRQNLSTSEQAKAITTSMKKQFPDVKVARRSDVYSGGSSIDFNIMSSDKDLYISEKDIDNLSNEQVHNMINDYNNGLTPYFDRWAEQNVPSYKNESTFTMEDVKRYMKEDLKNLKSRENQNVSGNEYYLSDYGKKVVSALNKEANSYTYDDSDGQVDYFNHGTYMNVSIGKWNKPYQVNENKKIKDYVSKKKSNHK